MGLSTSKRSGSVNLTGQLKFLSIWRTFRHAPFTSATLVENSIVLSLERPKIVILIGERESAFLAIKFPHCVQGLSS